MFVACGIWCLADVSSVSPSSEQTRAGGPPGGNEAFAFGGYLVVNYRDILSSFTSFNNNIGFNSSKVSKVAPSFLPFCCAAEFIEFSHINS